MSLVVSYFLIFSFAYSARYSAPGDSLRSSTPKRKGILLYEIY